MHTEIVARHYRTSQPWRVCFRDRAVESIEPVDVAPDTDLILAPALFDIQVNGFGGVDFNAPALQPEDLLAATRAMAQYGVARFLPTVITGPPDRMRACLETLVAAAGRFREVALAVAGIHLEGPYISSVDGARGVHDARWVHTPDEQEFGLLQDAARGTIALVTLAPELPGAIDFIRRRVAEGIVVGIGHTVAGLATVTAAVAAGARLSTHLGNGCESLLPRHENPITTQLGEDGLRASFIADGHHLPPYLLRSLIRAKGWQRSILTTDSMAAAGAPPGRYTLGDLELEVGNDRIVRRPGASNFAGSALTLDQAVANTSHWCGLPLAEAIEMASLHPAYLLAGFLPGHRQDSFTPNPGSDFILARETPAFALVATVRRGTCVYADPQEAVFLQT
jgi:N-acetylglucosamine-6-phosphate deacetylase